MNKNCLAIIPARSGSKGLPNKNILPLLGIPLLAHTVKAAIASGVFGTVFCSTDSREYADIATQFGASVPFLRPQSLSNDTSTSADMIVHTLSTFASMGMCFESFALLQPTSPLRNAKHMQEAAQLFEEKKANSVVSVCPFPHNPFTINTLPSNLSMEGFLKKSTQTIRQLAPIHYQLNGAIYFARVEHFLQHKDFYGEQSFAYVMDKQSSVDIDDEMDFMMATWLCERQKNLMK